MNNYHKGQVIPVPEERTRAYQSETSYPGAIIRSAPPYRDGNSDEGQKFLSYELIIAKHTDTALSITLRKERRDIVQQRKANGEAITHDVYVTTLDFAELCNRIFGPGYYKTGDKEAFPESVKEVMRKAYDRK